MQGTSLEQRTLLLRHAMQVRFSIMSAIVPVENGRKRERKEKVM